MVIDPASATQFIASYKSLLAEVHRQSGGKPHREGLQMLASAREAANANPALIDAAEISLRANGQVIPPDVLQAVTTLRLKQWVFLRDTTSHSIFIEPDGTEAYAVLGLTNRIRDIVGGSAVAIKTGVVEYQGRYVCDGIVESLVWLGSNLKKEFNATLSHARKNGRLHILCGH